VKNMRALSRADIQYEAGVQLNACDRACRRDRSTSHALSVCRPSRRRPGGKPEVGSLAAAQEECSRAFRGGRRLPRIQGALRRRGSGPTDDAFQDPTRYRSARNGGAPKRPDSGTTDASSKVKRVVRGIRAANASAASDARDRGGGASHPRRHQVDSVFTRYRRFQELIEYTGRRWP